MKMYLKGLVLVQFLLLSAISIAGGSAENIGDKVVSGVKGGGLVSRVTDVADFKAMFGVPLQKKTDSDGGSMITVLAYPGKLYAGFKQIEKTTPATLVYIYLDDKNIALGKPVLRTVADLAKLDKFIGLADVSLAKLDLREQKEFLSTMPFDSRTEWPKEDMLPPGFMPAQILENGKNPGLGLKELHEKGIDGRSVSMAIIDQPLLLEHQEYSSRIVFYSSSGVDGVEPQMHGPAVASFAAGKTIGTAPKASIYYFAGPSWRGDNTYLTDALKTIIEINSKKDIADKIHVVSISAGMFKQWANYGQWAQTLLKAQAEGILVITCDPEGSIDFGTLTRDPAKDVDSLDSYKPENWDSNTHPLWVPGGNRTRASYVGKTVYAFDVVGGKSWSTAYLAGVAALGYQLNPALTPEQVKDLLVKSAIRTKYGPVLNPAGFVELVRQTVKK